MAVSVVEMHVRCYLFLIVVAIGYSKDTDNPFAAMDHLDVTEFDEAIAIAKRSFQANCSILARSTRANVTVRNAESRYCSLREVSSSEGAKEGSLSRTGPGGESERCHEHKMGNSVWCGEQMAVALPGQPLKVYHIEVYAGLVKAPGDIDDNTPSDRVAWCLSTIRNGTMMIVRGTQTGKHDTYYSWDTPRSGYAEVLIFNDALQSFHCRAQTLLCPVQPKPFITMPCLLDPNTALVRFGDKESLIQGLEKAKTDSKVIGGVGIAAIIISTCIVCGCACCCILWSCKAGESSGQRILSVESGSENDYRADAGSDR